MTTPAANISEAVEFCADNIAELSYDAGVSIKTRMNDWIADLFAAGGIFTDVANAGQRRVIDWRGPSVLASAQIEGPLAGDSGVVGTSAVIDLVSRVLCAVRAAAGTGITVAQRDATVTAFNTQWT